MSRIVVIDDIIHESFLARPAISQRYRLTPEGFCKAVANDDRSISHGTLVAKILEQYTNDYELINVQITDNWFQTHRCPIEYLHQALKFCLEIPCDIINISLGSKRLSDMSGITPVIQEIQHAGIPLVAACSNTFHRTIPAAAHGVIGVACDSSNQLMPGTYRADYNPYLGTDYVANYVLNSPNVQPSHGSNSLAAAVITAQINNILIQKNDRILDWKAELDNRSSDRDSGKKKYPLYFADFNEVPVIYLVDILANQPEQQRKLLDLFNHAGYEVIAASSVYQSDDIRLIDLSSIGSNTVAKTQNSLCSCAKIDLVLFFVSSHWMTSQDWTGFDKESAAFICYDYMKDDPILNLFPQKHFVYQCNSLYLLYHELVNFLQEN